MKKLSQYLEYIRRLLLARIFA